MTPNERLHRLTRRRASARARQCTACLRRLRPLWAQLAREVGEALPGAVGAGTGGGVGRVQASLALAIAPLGEVAREAVQRASDTTGEALYSMALHELVLLPEALERILDSQIKAPSPVTAAALLLSPLGQPVHHQSFSDLYVDLRRGMRNVLMMGLFRNKTAAQMGSMLRGIVRDKWWQAERTVVSEFSRIGNQAALLVYQHNTDSVKAIQWLRAGKKWCPRCEAMSEKVWLDLAEVPLPVVATHPLCTCLLCPVV